MKTALSFFGAVVLCWMWEKHVKGTCQGSLDPIPDEWAEVFLLLVVLICYFIALGYP